jgi:hypothetical protein
MALAMFVVGTNAGRADQPEPPTAAKGLTGYNDQPLIDGLIGYLTLVAVQSSDATMTDRLFGYCHLWTPPDWVPAEGNAESFYAA